MKTDRPTRIARLKWTCCIPRVPRAEKPRARWTPYSAFIAQSALNVEHRVTSSHRLTAILKRVWTVDVEDAFVFERDIRAHSLKLASK